MLWFGKWNCFTFVHFKPRLRSRWAMLFLGACAKLRRTNIGFVMFVRMSVRPVRMEQLGSHWTDFHEIWYLRIFRKYVNRIQVWLKPDKKTVLHIRTYVHLWYLVGFLELEMFQMRVIEKYSRSTTNKMQRFTIWILTVSISLCTYNNFIKLCRLYTTNNAAGNITNSCQVPLYQPQN